MVDCHEEAMCSTTFIPYPKCAHLITIVDSNVPSCPIIVFKKWPEYIAETSQYHFVNYQFRIIIKNKPEQKRVTCLSNGHIYVSI